MVAERIFGAFELTILYLGYTQLVKLLLFPPCFSIISFGLGRGHYAHPGGDERFVFKWLVQVYLPLASVSALAWRLYRLYGDDCHPDKINALAFLLRKLSCSSICLF